MAKKIGSRCRRCGVREGEKTEIAWCDSTFNPWIGCQKVSAGCDNCYAETLMDKRYHKVNGVRTASGSAPARRTGSCRCAGTRPPKPLERRPRVFCSSLADVFDNQVPDPSWRIDLFDLIGETENLTGCC
jgi:protein gp37